MGIGTRVVSEDSVVAQLEIELAVFGRLLEGVNRRSEIHRELDRATYLLARSLAANGSSSINALAARLHLDATTVTRQVKTMEHAGLIRRYSDPSDGRVSRIELSRAGSSQMEKVRAAREARVAELFERWTNEDRRRFAKLLSQFNASVTDER
jgi:DNA-binding MarR family transcriptional regulator